MRPGIIIYYAAVYSERDLGIILSTPVLCIFIISYLVTSIMTVMSADRLKCPTGIDKSKAENKEDKDATTRFFFFNIIWLRGSDKNSSHLVAGSSNFLTMCVAYMHRHNNSRKRKIDNNKKKKIAPLFVCYWPLNRKRHPSLDDTRDEKDGAMPSYSPSTHHVKSSRRGRVTLAVIRSSKGKKKKPLSISCSPV